MTHPQEKLHTASKKPAPIVKGPIRCHKCQLSCQDATEYLGHTCQPWATLNGVQTRRFVDSWDAAK
jgi:hypothetical protein